MVLQVNAKLKHLLEDALVNDLSLSKTNQGALFPVDDGYTMAKVLVKELGYSVKSIRNGSNLSEFVAKQVKNAVQETSRGL